MTKAATTLARIEDALARLEALEAGAPPAPGQQVFDAHGNPGTVAPGDLIESAWGNAVKDRVVPKFPNFAALPALAEGTIAITTDWNFVWMRLGGAWKPTGLGNKPAFRIVGGAPGQSIAANSLTRCIWQTEQSDPFFVQNGGIFTVPDGWAGRWAFEWAVEFAAAGAGVRHVYAEILPGNVRLGEHAVQIPEPEGQTRLAGAASAVLPVGQTVSIIIYHTGPNAQACNVSADTNFTGYYVGPY